ncbi:MULTISPECIES: hypothetical protein [Roseomonadaceae]|uniref:Uncharacterized protein n=1 Tax=Falsiroseomonas oleicola TaxID=2801474 RepID=A0ABS6H8C9_9PROT|nr:hypothetical protein [Roseomonas oleicola]MBU8543968.1 hypothetical protein [Roseomonas oleicola]
MTPRRPWPPEPAELLPPFPIPGRRRLGTPTILVVLHDDATRQDRIDTARELLAGTGLTLAPESPTP